MPGSLRRSSRTKTKEIDMNRSFLTLGASVLALAMTSGPAWAASAAPQVVDDSIVAVQAGPVAVDAPVRVLSDGQNGSTAAPAPAGPQQANDSIGVVQAKSVKADAPVRVLSDGDNGPASAGGSGGATRGPQSVNDSAGAVQAHPIVVDAPVRVASDGDNGRLGGGAPQQSGDGSGGGAPSGTQSSTDSVGAIQVGWVDLDLPIRVLSDGDEGSTARAATRAQSSASSAGGLSDGNGESVPAGDDGAADDGGSPRGDTVAGTLPGVLTQPAGGRLAAAAVRTLDAEAAARLPVAGLGLIGLTLLGLLSLAGGSGLRLAQR
jgi:hypothetical protein